MIIDGCVSAVNAIDTCNKRHMRTDLIAKCRYDLCIFQLQTKYGTLDNYVIRPSEFMMQKQKVSGLKQPGQINFIAKL